jgi:hypothetical protein
MILKTGRTGGEGIIITIKFPKPKGSTKKIRKDLSFNGCILLCKWGILEKRIKNINTCVVYVCVYEYSYINMPNENAVIINMT